MYRKNILVLAVMFLAACAGPVPKIDSSPSALAQVNTIAVIRSREPDTYTVINFGHPGVAFGLIGGLVAAGDQGSKQDRLTEAVKQNTPAPTASSLADSIAAQLNRQGFEASVEDGPWEEKDGKFVLKFENIKSDADAVLVVSPTMVGFIATGLTSDYMPTITAVATLLGKDRKEQLYRGFHACGWQPKGDGWRHSSPRTTFANFDELMADPGKTSLALTDAAAEIAVTVAQDLRR